MYMNKLFTTVCGYAGDSERYKHAYNFDLITVHPSNEKTVCFTYDFLILFTECCTQKHQLSSISCLPRRMTKVCPQVGRCGNRKFLEYKRRVNWRCRWFLGWPQETWVEEEQHLLEKVTKMYKMSTFVDFIIHQNTQVYKYMDEIIPGNKRHLLYT